MSHGAFRFESTQFAGLSSPFLIDDADVHRAAILLNARRCGDERALGVVVINRQGMVARVVVGSGPLALAVGRHAGSDLCLPHADASLRHVVVVADDNGCAVFDLASSVGSAGATQASRPGLVVVHTSGSVVVAGVAEAGKAFLPFVVGVPHGMLQRRSVRHPTMKPAVFKTLPLSALLQSSTLQSSSLLIGRGSRNDIVTDNDGTSRVHAAVVAVVVGGRRRALLIDVGSTNGTIVLQSHDGRVVERALGPARRAVVIDAGDLVALGPHTRLTVVGSVDDAPYAARGGRA